MNWAFTFSVRSALWELKMNKRLIGFLALSMLALVSVRPAVGQDESGGYLGIGVESLHPALVMHLPETLLDGQGVIITHVAADSPAAKAGLKAHEILVVYDGQKLFSPEQLVKLVHADKPGHKAKVDVVQDGKLKSLEVTLGEQPKTIGKQARAQRWWERFPQIPLQIPSLQDADSKKSWKSFDSLTLKKLDGDRFKAEIEYLDDKVRHPASRLRGNTRGDPQAGECKRRTFLQMKRNTCFGALTCKALSYRVTFDSRRTPGVPGAAGIGSTNSTSR